ARHGWAPCLCEPPLDAGVLPGAPPVHPITAPYQLCRAGSRSMYLARGGLRAFANLAQARKEHRSGLRRLERVIPYRRIEDIVVDRGGAANPLESFALMNSYCAPNVIRPSSLLGTVTYLLFAGVARRRGLRRPVNSVPGRASGTTRSIHRRSPRFLVSVPP